MIEPEPEPREILKSWVSQQPSRQDAARALRVSEETLTSQMWGKRPITRRVAEVIGVTWVRRRKGGRV